MTITVEQLMALVRPDTPKQLPSRAAHSPGSQTRYGNTERGMPWTPAPTRDYLAAPLPAPTPDPAAVAAAQRRRDHNATRAAR